LSADSAIVAVGAIVVRWAIADAELVDRPLDIRVEAADEVLGLGDCAVDRPLAAIGQRANHP